MASTMASPAVTTHQERLQERLRLPRLPVAKADLKKVQKHEQWVEDGGAMAVACSLARLTRKEAAGRVCVPENQLAAWVAGAERPQTELFERDAMLSAPMAVAKAMLRPDVYEVRWTITALVQR